jgi:hypothetical protein
MPATPPQPVPSATPEIGKLDDQVLDTWLAGQAEAARIQAVGAAEASATKAQSEALGGPDAALRRAITGLLTDAIKNAKHPLVPCIVMDAGGQASITDLLMSIAVTHRSVGKALEPPAV